MTVFTQEGEPAPSGRIAARGAATTVGGQLARTGVQLVGVVILARLLTPADYGLTAMVIAIVGVGEVFRDFGLSSAAIQARTLTNGQRSNLFWINSGIGLVLGGLVAALAVPLSLFYSDPRIVAITLWLSLTFLFNGIATQFRAHLTRRFRFAQLALVDVASSLTALAVGVSVALAGYGYWAIVCQSIALALTTLILSTVASRWMPTLPDRRASVRPLFAFGWPVAVVNLLGYASRNVDSVVIGSIFGAAPLGLYNRAYQLLALPLNQLNAPATRVALPVLSRLQDDPARYADFLLRGQTVLIHFVMLGLTWACAVAPSLIVIVLGAQWAGSVLLFQILAVGGLFQVAAYATYWVFVSLGHTRSNLIFALSTRPVVILLIAAGALFGVTGVAAGYSLGMALLWPAGLVWVRRLAGAPAGRMFLNGLRPLLGYAAAGAVAYVIGTRLPLSGVAAAGAGTAMYLAAVALIVLVWPALRRDLRAALSTARYLRTRRSSAEGPTT